MNVNKVLTKDYENERLCRGFKNKAEQTQSNPAPLRPEKYPPGLLFANDGI